MSSQVHIDVDYFSTLHLFTKTRNALHGAFTSPQPLAQLLSGHQTELRATGAANSH